MVRSSFVDRMVCKNKIHFRDQDVTEYLPNKLLLIKTRISKSIFIIKKSCFEQINGVNTIGR